MKMSSYRQQRQAGFLTWGMFALLLSLIPLPITWVTIQGFMPSISKKTIGKTTEMFTPEYINIDKSSVINLPVNSFEFNPTVDDRSNTTVGSKSIVDWNRMPISWSARQVAFEASFYEHFFDKAGSFPIISMCGTYPNNWYSVTELHGLDNTASTENVSPINILPSISHLLPADSQQPESRKEEGCSKDCDKNSTSSNDKIMLRANQKNQRDDMPSDGALEDTATFICCVLFLGGYAFFMWWLVEREVTINADDKD